MSSDEFLCSLYLIVVKEDLDVKIHQPSRWKNNSYIFTQKKKKLIYNNNNIQIKWEIWFRVGGARIAAHFA